MRNLGIAVILTLSSAQAFAIPNWNAISSDTEQATTLEEFLVLQQKYPDNLASYDPTQVSRASVQLTTYQYIGASICPIDDPQLLFQSILTEVCDNNEFCTQNNPELPGQGDPCDP